MAKTMLILVNKVSLLHSSAKTSFEVLFLSNLIRKIYSRAVAYKKNEK